MTSLSVIVSTYNWPEAVDAVLFGLSEQTDRDFEVVVADDGSGPETAAVVERWRDRVGIRLASVRQPDEGFRLARVKNLGALEARGDYLVLIDGDAIPRCGFVAALRAAAVPGWFVATKRLELDRDLTRRMLAERPPLHRWSAVRWAREWRHATPLVALTSRDRRRPGRDGLPDFVPHGNRYGVLFGVSRADFERVNGFDIRFEDWGEEDVDLAVRLHRLGLRCGWPGPQATLLHLWHQRRTGERPNAALVEGTRAADRVEAVVGLREQRAELALS
jgi:glycosyltransferase involved in cell wall biosynthesis